MIIGIDIDDTLSSLTDLKINVGQEYIKQNNLQVKLKNPSAYYLSEMYDWDDETRKKFWWESYLPNVQNAPLQPGASEITHKLKSEGHTIIVITARSDRDHHDAYEESYAWLEKNNIYFDKLIINGHDKGALCKENNVEIFLDDYIPNITRIKEVGVEPVVFSSRHNTSFEDETVKRVETWQEFYDYIKQVEVKN